MISKQTSHFTFGSIYRNKKGPESSERQRRRRRQQLMPTQKSNERCSEMFPRLFSRVSELSTYSEAPQKYILSLGNISSYLRCLVSCSMVFILTKHTKNK